MSEVQRGILDTSVIIDLEKLDVSELPNEVRSVRLRWPSWLQVLTQLRTLRLELYDRIAFSVVKQHLILCRLMPERHVLMGESSLQSQ